MNRITILGLNGNIGRATATAFADAGWQVRGMARRSGDPIPGVTLVEGSADSVDDLRRAIGESEVVLNALNLPYPQWWGGRHEALMERVRDAMGRDGRTLLFPGNIYNFSRTDRFITPDLVQRPETPRGAIRVRVETSFREAAARGDLQFITLRAGDFYGPTARGDWFEQLILAKLGKGRVTTMGKPGVPHAWAYLPDLARAFTVLAENRARLGAVENFHFAGHFVTSEQVGDAIRAVMPTVRLKNFPLWQLAAAGFFSPLMRELSRMDYLWRHPMELRDDRLETLLGKGFETPFDTAIASVVTTHLAAIPLNLNGK